MSVPIFLSTFTLIFVAELGDKTQLAAMALASRYPWRRVFAGIAAAFFLLNLAAVLLGGLLYALIPALWIELAAAALFLYFGLATLMACNGDDEDASTERKSRGPFLASFFMILVAELGDKTQLVTATLAARHGEPLTVFMASTLALWLVSLLGIFVGSQLRRLVPPATIQRSAGVLFLLFGVVMLVRALV
ncbi:MAG TPA: TMEM165/GDT1 family protein [Geobacterales bacterium]|nr:TMEM165/GDT1 family protein [Geobacterales bacterium]